MSHSSLHTIVQSETLFREIQRQSESFPLFMNVVSVVIFPFPGLDQESISSQLVFINTFFLKFLLDFCLGCYSGMIHSGKIQNIKTLQSLISSDDILFGSILSMSDMKHTSDIWRRNNQRILWSS